jgi:sarcosine oxidase subunit delta
VKLLRCPINGVRPIQEFAYGGELREMPDPTGATDAQWANHVFNRAGEPGVKREWWYHVASGTWFIAERDTLKDEFVRTYLYDESVRAGENTTC